MLYWPTRSSSWFGMGPVWYGPGFSPPQCHLPVLPFFMGKTAPPQNLHGPRLRSPIEPSLALRVGGDGQQGGRRVALLAQFCFHHLVQDLGSVVVEENIWEISISCPALQLPILLSPEQGRRTEEPLNCSQHADWGGFAAVGSGHMLGAGRLGQLLCGRFLLSRPLIPSSELCCDGESMSFAGDRGKPLRERTSFY